MTPLHISYLASDVLYITMKHVAMALLLILLLASPVYAAVGGGGGSPSGGSTGSSSGSSSGGGKIPYFTDPKCTDKGSISFFVYPKPSEVIAINPDNKTFSVSGSWEDDFFQSYEALFNLEGPYTINNKTANCPGLKFSCRIVNISL